MYKGFKKVRLKNLNMQCTLQCVCMCVYECVYVYTGPRLWCHSSHDI